MLTLQPPPRHRWLPRCVAVDDAGDDGPNSDLPYQRWEGDDS